MKSIFMRVLLCKIQCPCSFICFCKPSAAAAAAAAHLYTPAPLKLENTPHVPSSTTLSGTQLPCCDGETNTTIEVKDGILDGKKNQQQQQQQEEEQEQEQEGDNALKSCIRKSPSALKDLEKKRVQWMDNLGKELVEIKEFESSETGDTDNEEDNRGCVCTIL